QRSGCLQGAFPRLPRQRRFRAELTGSAGPLGSGLDRRAAAQIDLADVAIGVALHAGDAAVAPMLPFAYGVLAIPYVVEPAVLLRQAQTIAFAHIEIGAGNGATAVVGRHGSTLFEVDHER